MIKGFEKEFNSKFEMMKALDIARFYYSFRKYGHTTNGKFYKYL